MPRLSHFLFQVDYSVFNNGMATSYADTSIVRHPVVGGFPTSTPFDLACANGSHTARVLHPFDRLSTVRLYLADLSSIHTRVERLSTIRGV